MEVVRVRVRWAVSLVNNVHPTITIIQHARFVHPSPRVLATVCAIRSDSVCAIHIMSAPIATSVHPITIRTCQAAIRFVKPISRATIVERVWSKMERVNATRDTCVKAPLCLVNFITLPTQLVRARIAHAKRIVVVTAIALRH